MHGSSHTRSPHISIMRVDSRELPLSAIPLCFHVILGLPGPRFPSTCMCFVLLHLRLSNFKNNLYYILVQYDIIFHDVKWKWRQQFWHHTLPTFHNGNTVCDLLMFNKHYWSKESVQFWYCVLILRNIGIFVPRILSFISNHLIFIAI